MRKLMLYALIGAGAIPLSACDDDDDHGADAQLNQRPSFVEGEVAQTRYYGVNDDLLTGGLGANGLASATAPAFADPANPTAAELRTLAIYNNYRALVDTAPGGGYGEFFGPQVDARGEGKIAGQEFIAYLETEETGRVTAMVQVPDSFDPAEPCMVTAPSSGSRGIYGAIGTAGEWGLKHGCAVVYTDKGSGIGSHNLATNSAQLIDGRLTDDPDAPVQFRANLSADERSAFNGEYPNRFAFKHAHSQVNPEAHWGQYVLQSIEFGFYVLNEAFGETNSDGERLRTITPENTLVIASSVSNGGGASVRAAEEDTEGWIDGVAVSEPNVNPAVSDEFAIQQGEGPLISNHSRSLFDYSTALALYQGCANLAPGIRTSAPLNEALNNFAVNENICSALSARGLVAGTDTDAQATDAQRILNERFAIQPEQNLLAPLHFGVNVPQSIATTYANSYGRFGVEDRICELSMAATDSTGAPLALSTSQEAALFATSNGIPPSAGINLVFDDASGGPTNLPVSVSPESGLQDYGLDALVCLRSLAEGQDPVTETELAPERAEQAEAVAEGIDEIRATGDLNGKPAIFVTGRADAILPINHSSRPYFGLNRSVEGDDSGLRYYEILNAHHLDALNSLPGLNENYIPLHHYYFQALDLMYAHLQDETDLPPSQVIRTTPRGAGAPALTSANLPPIDPQPEPGDRIVFEDYLVQIPD